MFLGTLGEHECAAGRDLDSARRLPVAVALPQEAQVDVERADALGIIVSPQGPVLQTQAGGDVPHALPRVSPDSNRNPSFSQRADGSGAFRFPLAYEAHRSP